MEKDYGISVTRIVATIMIVCCHFFPAVGIMEWLRSVFDVGVPIFLLISGMLYGKKIKIINVKKFYLKNWIKICIPMYIWLFIVVMLHAYYGERYSYITIFTYLFNLQGIGWIFDFITIELIGDIGILWFFTVIMMCYFIYPLLMRKKHFFSKPIVFISFAAFVFIANYVGIHLWYFVVWMIGLYYGDIIKKIHNSNFVMVIYTCITAGTQLLRLFLRIYIDDTILYKYILSSITHLIFAIWIMNVCIWVTERIRIERIHTVIDSLDRVSIYVYIVHYSFLRGVFAMNTFIKEHLMVGSLGYIVIIAGTAYLLKRISDYIIKKLVITLKL